MGAVLGAVAAADQVLKEFPEADCQLYFATLIALEGGVWEALRPRAAAFVD